MDKIKARLKFTDTIMKAVNQGLTIGDIKRLFQSYGALQQIRQQKVKNSALTGPSETHERLIKPHI